MHIDAVTDEIAKKAGMAEPRGALVVRVNDNGPMQASNVRPGDVIVQFDRHGIAGIQDLHNLILSTPPGKQVEVVVVRKGKEETKNVTVARMPDSLAYYERGRDYYFNKRDYDRALADYNQAIRLDPKLAAAYGGRGAVYERMRATGIFGDANDWAFTDYRTALALTPGDQWATAGIKRILTNDAPALADLIHTASAFTNPAGHYLISGTNPDGTTYTGDVVVEPAGGEYQVSWTAAGRKSVGTAVPYLDFLAVSLRRENDLRVALLMQEGEGRVGVWVRDGEQQMGSERWARQSAEVKTNPSPAPAVNPEGSYALAGANADGSTYSGEIVVRRVGNVFEVAKTLGGQRSVGTGIAHGNFFAVTYRPGFHVALLTSHGSGEIGIWADNGSGRLGTERWVRK